MNHVYVVINRMCTIKLQVNVVGIDVHANLGLLMDIKEG